MYYVPTCFPYSLFYLNRLRFWINTINMQTMKMNIRQEQTIKATEVSMAMYCKASCETWKREVVGVGRAESAEGIQLWRVR